VDLVVLGEREGAATQLAMTSLGDRAQVQGLALVEGTVVVIMVTHGPDDPTCCPTHKVENTYALQEGNLVEIASKVLGKAATTTAATLDGQLWKLDTRGLAQSAKAYVIPATAYDASQPPGPKGLPEHIMVTFDGAAPTVVGTFDPVLYIIPVAAYEQLGGKRQLWRHGESRKTTGTVGRATIAHLGRARPAA